MKRDLLPGCHPFFASRQRFPVGRQDPPDQNYVWSCTERRPNMFNTQPIFRNTATMEGFIMNVVRHRFTQHALIISLALTASTLSHANTVKVIFAAENALYGAGYDIGRADGWMDSSLKKAIRQYQDRSDHLRTSGVLDSDTLTSLGIHHKAGTTISGNTVGKKGDALSALGISNAAPEQAAKAEPKREKIVAKAFTVPLAPEPDGQPEPDKAAEKPEPAPASNPAPANVIAEDEAKPEVEATQEALSKPATTVTSKVAEIDSTPDEESPPTVQNKSQSYVDHQDPVVTADVTEPPVKAAAPSSAETAQQDDPSAQLPDEPTAAGMPQQASTEVQAGKSKEVPEAQAEATGDNRSIFGTLFDFLFGWMA
ncbi:peptidoglycan-binding domain-containing protein [Marinobacter sp. F4206]|uniref:peptidoglycan-binding domain-containing protein n=1 Tax=Marinobacter sp. F4206 TaxID=2861777 RepID=UPI001C5E53B5|nr:peptidoglycan-binding domain-containing protein [Marinobacter sp. F4206]MBW4933115.1 peptidoglycan-binding protein [Marinobacter sp. F4206]